MAAAVLTDPRFAVIWINATGPGEPATAVGGVPAAAKFCAINSKALNQSLATGTAIVPDCTDVKKVSIIKRTAQSKDWSITGTGYFELTMRNDLQKIMDNGVSVGVVFEIIDDLIPPVNSGYYAGHAFLETFNFIANTSDSYITVDINFAADGPLSWTAVP
jgi:hypothetical protein